MCRIFLSFCIARVTCVVCVIRLAGEYCGPDKYNIVIPLPCSHYHIGKNEKIKYVKKKKDLKLDEASKNMNERYSSCIVD